MESRMRVVKIGQNVRQLAHYFHTPGDHTVVFNRENFPNYSYYKYITTKFSISEANQLSSLNTKFLIPQYLMYVFCHKYVNKLVNKQQS